MRRGKSTSQNKIASIAYADEPSQSSSLTEYDRQHLALYIRLLDAADQRAEWTEVVRVLFGLDPNRDGERARRIHDSHLARARWMKEHGYRDLLRSAMH
jgi:Uncharacterized conserved protein (DUF2285)